MKLPEAFISRMQQMLGTEFEEFLASYEMPRYNGVRINTLKVAVEEFKRLSPFQLEPVPWTSEGFYTGIDARPAKHPYYHAGLYYIQEPSAMITAEVLNPEPGDKVLDLCAAPGGKSTQIAARLAGDGLLVANDIKGERLKGLVRNLEIFGVRNSIILNELPARLAQRFPFYFDKIVIDAPCSGEGMFRKDPHAVKSWGEFSVEKCTVMQNGILKYASEMLKPGGLIIYSTCTFAPEENEGMIDRFLKANTEFEVVDITHFPGLSPGRPEWAEANESLSRTGRLWPHKIRGEGHFVALLRKTDGDFHELKEYKQNSPPFEEIKDFYTFTDDNLNALLEDSMVQRNSKLYAVPAGIPDLAGLKVTRPGWLLGELKKNRFKPAASLAMGLKKKDARRSLDFPSQSPELMRYLKGETLNMTGERGWTLVCVDGFPLGWAKQLADMLSNYYSAGWRWMD